MSDTPDELRETSLLREAGFFALYIVLIALGLFVGLVVWRVALGVVIYEWLSLTPWLSRLIYMIMVVGGAFAMVVGLLAAEPYLNGAKRRGHLARSFLRAALPLAVLGIVGYVIMITSRGS
jgi:hypothetical protein